MSLKAAIEEIPSLVKMLKDKFNEKVEQNFKDAKLKDGTIISYDGETPSVGMPLFVVDEGGNRLPAPDGEHTLEDGSVYIVTGGMIAEIKTAEGDPAASEEMNDDAKAATQAQAIKSVVESVIKETVFSNKTYEDKFSALEKENTSLKKEVEKLSDLLKQTFSLVEKIAEAPSVKPSEKKDGFMKKEPQGKLERLMEEAKELTNKTFKN